MPKFREGSLKPADFLQYGTTIHLEPGESVTVTYDGNNDTKCDITYSDYDFTVHTEPVDCGEEQKKQKENEKQKNTDTNSDANPTDTTGTSETTGSSGTAGTSGTSGMAGQSSAVPAPGVTATAVMPQAQPSVASYTGGVSTAYNTLKDALTIIGAGATLNEIRKQTNGNGSKPVSP